MKSVRLLLSSFLSLRNSLVLAAKFTNEKSALYHFVQRIEQEKGSKLTQPPLFRSCWFVARRCTVRKLLRVLRRREKTSKETLVKRGSSIYKGCPLTKKKKARLNSKIFVFYPLTRKGPIEIEDFSPLTKKGPTQYNLKVQLKFQPERTLACYVKYKIQHVVFMNHVVELQSVIYCLLYAKN